MKGRIKILKKKEITKFFQKSLLSYLKKQNLGNDDDSHHFKINLASILNQQAPAKTSKALRQHETPCE